MPTDAPPELLVPPPLSRWLAQVPVPGQRPYGVWTPFAWQHDGRPQHGAVLTPTDVPWRRLFEALDRVGARLPSEPVSLLEEADAVVAACWRYGTFFHTLTFGQAYPLFRSDRGLSRINDTEMMRVNVETSAALADWLVTRAADPERIRRRARAAHTLLPMPWNRGRSLWEVEFVGEGASRAAGRLESLVASLSGTPLPPSRLGRALNGDLRTRMRANAMVLKTYRNGPIEDHHAGTWSLGSETPGFSRLYAAEVKHIAKRMAERMALEMGMFDRLSSEAALRYVDAIAPHDWTLTAESSFSAYPGVPGGPLLQARVEELAERYPTAYTAAVRGGSYDGYHGRFVPASVEPGDAVVLLDATAGLRPPGA